MNYPSISGAPVFSKHGRATSRNLNVPSPGNVPTEMWPKEMTQGSLRALQYQKPLWASDPKFVRAPLQSSAAPCMPQHIPRRISSLRPEQESYYENYYTPYNSPPTGHSNAYQAFKQNAGNSDPRMMEPMGERVYRDIEGDEDDEDEIDTIDYVSLPNREQQQDMSRGRQSYYPTVKGRETAYYDPFISQAHRRASKSPARSFDMLQQPTSDGILPARSRAPMHFSKQQGSEPLHGRSMQSKPGKQTSRSFYDPESSHYTRNHSPERDLYEGRKNQDFHPLGNQDREKLLEQMQQQRKCEVLKQIFPDGEDPILQHGDEVSMKSSQQCLLSPKECLNIAKREDEYLNKLQQMFQDEADDIQRLFHRRKADLERRNPRSKSPTPTFHH